MPKAKSITEPGKIATDKESKSSASQLAHFGVRLAKFTHDFAADGGADFASNYVLPNTAAVLSVSVNVETAYTGATTATIRAGSTAIASAMTVTATGVAQEAKADVLTSADQSFGDLTIDFDAPATAGKMTVAVAWIDLSELS